MDYLTALFCQIDDFCQEFEPLFNRSLIESRKTRNRKSCISTAEIITVWIYFHHLRMRDFKTYYLWQIKTMLRRELPDMPSYNRFVELAQHALPAMLVFLKTQMGHCTDVGVVDSTTLAVCHNRRIHSYKVFKDIAKRGKTSTGWFYGFKLHAVFNHLGELLIFCLTAGNTDDRLSIAVIVWSGRGFG